MKPIKRVGLDCVGAAAYPLFTPIRRVGLLTLWFAQGAAVLNLGEAEHLDRVALELRKTFDVNTADFTIGRDPKADQRFTHNRVAPAREKRVEVPVLEVRDPARVTA